MFLHKDTAFPYKDMDLVAEIEKLNTELEPSNTMRTKSIRLPRSEG